MAIDYNKTLTALIGKLKQNQTFILSIIAFIFIFIFFVLPTITDYLNSSEEREFRKEIQRYKIELKVQRERDSIEELKKIQENELFMYKNNQINDLMSYLEKRFPTSSHITIYSVHNGGGVPRTGKAKHQTVVYTVDNVKGVNILKEYEQYPLYPGYAEYAFQQLKRQGEPFYVADVSAYPAIWNDKETRENMLKLNTKSMFGMWIKTTGTHTYYISASFNEVNGMEEAGNFPRVILQDARRKLVKLIE